MIIAIDPDKVLYKSQHALMIKTLKKLEIEENILDLIKDIHENPQLMWCFVVKDKAIFGRNAQHAGS